MKKCAVIYNPISGKHVKYKFLPQFEKMLNNYGYEANIFYTEYRDMQLKLLRI